MSDVTLSSEQYTALLSLARKGVSSPDQARNLEVFLKDIDKRNGLIRYTLLIQWQELDSPVPPGAIFPDKWPPELRALLERSDRPIAKADVMGVLNTRAKKPHEVLVTRDPAGLVGWTKLDSFFVT